jgi:Protein of unknown function (DUF2817)
MYDSSCFSASYSEARQKFRDAVSAAGGKLEVFRHPLPGPAGEELSTDAAWFGSPRATRVLVLVSGTHGVEGYCGSGAQVDWLRRGEFRSLPDNVSALLIHAINPWGFAWTRRVNEDNVDLNRNWIDFEKDPPRNDPYLDLADDLCPSEWTSEAQRQTTGRLLTWREQHGNDAFQQAISGGQYTHPLGLFYGGAQPSWSRQTQAAIISKYLARAERVGVIDYHTGLGPLGYAERIVVSPKANQFSRAVSWYGKAITTTQKLDEKSGEHKSTSSNVAGDSLSALFDLLPNAEITGIAFEVGTVPILEVLQALRVDAWLHAYGDVNSELGVAIKRQVRAAFYCESDFWKGMIAGQSLTTCHQAIAALRE